MPRIRRQVEWAVWELEYEDLGHSVRILSHTLVTTTQREPLAVRQGEPSFEFVYGPRMYVVGVEFKTYTRHSKKAPESRVVPVVNPGPRENYGGRVYR